MLHKIEIEVGDEQARAKTDQRLYQRQQKHRAMNDGSRMAQPIQGHSNHTRIHHAHAHGGCGCGWNGSFFFSHQKERDEAGRGNRSGGKQRQLIGAGRRLRGQRIAEVGGQRRHQPRRMHEENWQRPSNKLADDDGNEAENKVQAEQMRALVRGAIPGEKRRVDDEGEGDADTSDERAHQQRDRLTKKNLSRAREANQQIGPDQDRFAAKAVDTITCREDRQSAANGADKQHQPDEIRVVAKRGKVEVVEQQKNTRRNPAQRVADKVQAGIALETRELPDISDHGLAARGWWSGRLNRRDRRWLRERLFRLINAMFLLKSRYRLPRGQMPSLRRTIDESRQE